MASRSGKARKVKHKGQANLITVTILVGATLAMALALMAYFTGQASRASEERGLSDYLAALSYSIDSSIVARYSYTDSQRNVTGYCYVVQVTWTQSTSIRLYLTVLPASRVTPNFINVDLDLLKYVPRRIESRALGIQPEQTVYVYLVSDIDRDGIVELVGNNNVVISEQPPSCREMMDNIDTIKSYELPHIDVPMNSIYLSVDVTLENYASTKDISYDVPVWSLLFDTEDRVKDIFIYIEVPGGQAIEDLNLVFFGLYNNNYYASYYAPLPPP